MNNLKEKIERMGVDAAKQDFDRSSWHSSRYHRDFDGYREVVETDKETGKAKIKRIYTKEYYIAEVSKKVWNRRKALYPLLTCIAFAMYALAACSDNAANYIWYATLPQAALVFVFIFLALFELRRCFLDLKLTVGQYREAVKYIRALSATASLILLLSAVLVAINSVIISAYAQLYEALEFIAAAMCMMLIYKTENSTEYRREKNEELALGGLPV